MSRAAFYTGGTGGILGSLMGVTGILWCIYNITYLMDLYRYVSDFFDYWFFLDEFAYFFLPVHSSGSWFGVISIILVILLIVSGILTGIGFYGAYRTGGGAMGVVGLIFGSAGITLGALFILLGIAAQELKTPYPWMYPFYYYPFGYLLPLFGPNFLYIWLGLVILAVTFILLGVSSIVVRESTGNSSASLAAGILSIIGACFLVPYVLVWIDIIAILGCIFALIGFVLIMVAFILWAAVFFSSRNL